MSKDRFRLLVVKTAERKRLTGNVFSNVWRQRFLKCLFWWSPGGSTWASTPSFVSNCKSYSPKMRSSDASCTITLCIFFFAGRLYHHYHAGSIWMMKLTIHNVVPVYHIWKIVSGWTSRTGFVCYLNISLDIQRHPLRVRCFRYIVGLYPSQQVVLDV